MEFVAVRLTATQLTELRNSVTKGMGQPGITRMDVVVALFARCLSEVEPESKPIDSVLYVINVCESAHHLSCSSAYLLTAPRNGGLPN